MAACVRTALLLCGGVFSLGAAQIGSVFHPQINLLTATPGASMGNGTRSVCVCVCVCVCCVCVVCVLCLCVCVRERQRERERERERERCTKYLRSASHALATSHKTDLSQHTVWVAASRKI